MNNDINYKKQSRSGKTIAGAILLVLGCILLVQQLNMWFLPGWVTSWPWILIFSGLYMGAKSNFNKPVWFILVVIGVAFLADNAFDYYKIDSDGVIWPVMFIVFGIWIILRRNNKPDDAKWRQFEEGGVKQKVDFGNVPPADLVVDYTVKTDEEPIAAPKADGTMPPPYTGTGKRPYTDDYLNSTALFGGVDKIILSKDFRGGDVVNIFGGTEIDFTKADIHGVVIIEVTQVFGATKMIIPPHWHVITDMASIFAGVDDKRMRHVTTVNNDKVLVIKGTSIFAGIDIRSF